MRMMSIASGSSGNCIYIGTDNTHLLIDDGISKKKVLDGLLRLGLKADDIDAVLITHEHDDHIMGLGVLERYCRIPVYATQGTISGIRDNRKLGEMPQGIYNDFAAGDSFRIGDIDIHTVSISHDARDPVAYTFESENRKAGIITDLGCYTDNIIDSFSGLDTLLIESNHDYNMLMTGPYPYMLKQRISGIKGHLSNEECGKLLSYILSENTSNIFLGHLSRENNFPELAFETVRLEIEANDCADSRRNINIRVAARSTPSDIVDF